MPQFAVYQNKKLWNSASFPLLVEVQSEMFEDLDTCLVVPLSNLVLFREFPLSYLTPEIILDGEFYLLMTPQLAAVARADLGPHVDSVAAQERVISDALDFLIRGYC